MSCIIYDETAPVPAGVWEASVTGYTKLFSSIVMSSVWEEPADTRLVWVTLLALADQDGLVEGTARSLARVARVPLEAAQTALETFLAPDPFDRSGVAEGRRLEPVEGRGWRLINHAAYRHRMSVDERRGRDAIRKRESRSRPQTSAMSPKVLQQNRTEAEQNKDNLMVFTTAGEPAHWALTKAQVERWQKETYPTVDVVAECRKAGAWLDANHMKTASGMKRFLVNWLNRATNQTRGSATQPQTPTRTGGVRTPAWFKPTKR